ncbi:MAG: hypothetical protein M3P32_04165 [Chloroflexota bacterium]|nr:hypothetical protein [Chloroflexota bacterium]
MTLSILLTACASPGGSTGPIDHPTGDDLVLRIHYSGGMLGPILDFTGFPPFTLSGDGRVIVPGAQIELFPGPALPAVNVRRLTEDGIQAVLNEVARTGLFGTSIEFRGAQNCVMDASDTVFTLHADGRDVTVAVYGLGTVDPGMGCQGASAAEMAAHRALQTLSERLATLEAWLPASAWAEATSHPYRPSALRLVVRNADADLPDDSGIGNALLDWPDASDPTTFGDPGPFDGQRCGIVSGEAAQDWYAALSEANQLTRFVKDDHRYEVTVRLMLPDEPLECPTVAV